MNEVDPRRIERLLEFEFPDVRRIVAREAPVMDMQLAKAIERKGLLQEALHNPALPQEFADQVVDARMRSFDAAIESHARSADPGDPMLPNIARAGWSLPSPAEDLAAVDGAGHRISRDVVRRLKDVAVDPRMGYARPMAAEALAGLHHHTTPPDIEALLDSGLEWTPEALLAVGENPHLPVERARWVARQARTGKMPEVARALAARPDAGADPTLFATLRAIKDEHVLAALVPSCEPAAFGALFAELASIRRQVQIGDVVKNARPEQVAAIRPTDWRQTEDGEGYVIEAFARLPGIWENEAFLRDVAGPDTRLYRPRIATELLAYDQPPELEAYALTNFLEHESYHWVIQVLERYPRVRRAATPKHIAALLACPDSEVRSRALLLVGQMRHLDQKQQVEPAGPARA